MKTPFAALLITLTCFALVPAALPAQGDAKPIKKTVPAEDGLPIVCEVRGKGDTAIVFLHGLCGDRAYWKNQVDTFAPNYTIVALDQAGHGESGKNRKAWTIAGLAGDVESVVKSLGLKRVILVGHSMGGPVGLAAAKRMPGKVIAVVGADTLQNVEFKMPEEQSTQLFKAFETDFKGTFRTGMDGMLNEKVDPELKNWLATRAAAQDPKVAIGLMRDFFGADQKVLLKEAKVPVRCINSSGGYQFFNPTAVDVNKKYGDYNAVMMDAIGHYPMLERPAEFNDKLRVVLKEFAGR